IRRLTLALETKTLTLARLASTDSLTGLGNRRSLEERLPIELERANRYVCSVSIIMIDIDHLREVNRSHNHETGDEVLRFAGQIIQKMTRAADLSFRYSGEIFVVIAPETTAAHAQELGERLRKAFSRQSPEASAAGAQ